MKRLLFKLYLVTMRGESMRWLPLRRWLLGRLLGRPLPDLEVHANVYISGWWALQIGERVTINRNCTLLCDGGLTIGDHCLIAPDCSIVTTEHEYRGDEPIRDQPVTSHPVTIGRDVWLGARAIVLGGSSIADGSIVAAGALVKGRFDEACSIVAGVPAKRIGGR